MLNYVNFGYTEFSCIAMCKVSTQSKKGEFYAKTNMEEIKLINWVFSLYYLKFLIKSSIYKTYYVSELLLNWTIVIYSNALL